MKLKILKVMLNRQLHDLIIELVKLFYLEFVIQ